MNERLRWARESLNLSQDFVARHLGMKTTDIESIENGTRKVTDDDLSAFSRLYGITVDTLLHGNTDTEQELRALGKPFTELSGIDRYAVFGLLQFRQRLRKRGCA